MFIERNFSQNIQDDYASNVAPALDETMEAVPTYHEGMHSGWAILPRFE